MKRRTFIKTSAIAGMGLLSSRMSLGNISVDPVKAGYRVGIIGLDTSHAIAFTNVLNAANASADYCGYKVVAAYPQGSKDIQSSVSRVPGYIEDVKKKGVEIVDSISKLLELSDVILLESNDGRVHLEQVIPVFRAKKTVFIDKPIAGSLADAYAIFQAAKDFNVPVFSSSSLRYMQNMDDIVKNQCAGKILGAEIYGPCSLESSHPDFFWYGIHCIEALYTVMGTGCQTVSRVHTPNTDVAVGIWEDNRIATFRGIRSGKSGYGGNVFGDKEIKSLGDYGGYEPLLKEITKFFQTGVSPVLPEETLEIFTFMEAAEESKWRNGATVNLAEVRQKAISQVRKIW